MDDTLKIILENWQVVFLYGLKILSDIRKALVDHDTRITKCEIREELKKELDKKV